MKDILESIVAGIKLGIIFSLAYIMLDYFLK
jgi:hypothetical protein